MAIEITQKPKFTIPSWTAIVLAVCLTMIIGLSLSYLYFIQTSGELKKEIEKKDNAIRLITPSQFELEKEVLKKQEKVNNFSRLLETHKKAVNVLTFLEKVAHPKIWFSDFNFNYSQNTVTVKGKVPDFNVLGQQMISFKKESVFKSINLNEASLEETGEIKFSIQFAFEPQIFK